MSSSTFIGIATGVPALASIATGLFVLAGILRNKRIAFEQVVVLTFVVLAAAFFAFISTHAR